MGAIAILTWDGRIDAAQTRAFLERFDEERVIEAGDNGWHAWSNIVEQLAWTDFVPRVEQAYADGRIWVGIRRSRISVVVWRRRCKRRRTTARGSAMAGSVISPMRSRNSVAIISIRWKNRLCRSRRHQHQCRGSQPQAGPVPTPPRERNARTPMRNVGRNDPCPCGSGKKYKKCCLAA